MNKYQRAGYKNRKDYLRAFKHYIKPYLELTLPEEMSQREKKKEIKCIKKALLKDSEYYATHAGIIRRIMKSWQSYIKQRSQAPV